jgi:hypothetical protein
MLAVGLLMVAWLLSAFIWLSSFQRPSGYGHVETQPLHFSHDCRVLASIPSGVASCERKARFRMGGVALPNPVLGQIANLLRTALRALHLTVRPAERHHEIMAVFVAGEVQDRIAEGGMPDHKVDQRVYYEVINPKSRDFEMKYEYVRTTSRGAIVLLAGRPWKKKPMGYDPSEVRKVE